MSKSLLVIDDEQMILDAISAVLVEKGCEVVATANPDEGVAAAVARPFDLILTDLRMRSKNGAAVTEAIRAARPEARILVMTGFSNDPLARRALDAGAIDVIRKPFRIATILEFLEA